VKLSLNNTNLSDQRYKGYASISIIKQPVSLLLRAVHKNRRNQWGRGFIRCKPLYFCRKKTQDFLKIMVCPREQRGENLKQSRHILWMIPCTKPNWNYVNVSKKLWVAADSIRLKFAFKNAADSLVAWLLVTILMANKIQSYLQLKQTNKK